MPQDIVISARRVIPAAAFTIRTARAQGPGGQHVNRTESKVQMVFDPRKVDWIDDGTRLRLIALAGRNVDSEGCVLVMSQEYREQGRNLDEVKSKLVELLQRAMTRPKRRLATKPSRAAKARRVDEKKQRSRTKAGRGKVSRDD
jgi:ribosome-associated protein